MCVAALIWAIVFLPYFMPDLVAQPGTNTTLALPPPPPINANTLPPV